MKKSILNNINMDNGLEVTLKMLEAYPMQYIGIIGLDDKPKVKAFEFKFEQDGLFYFDTIKESETHKELSQNPYIELSIADSESLDWIRISGKVIFNEDDVIKEKLLQSSEILRTYYGHQVEKILPFYLSEVIVRVGNMHLQKTYQYQL